MGAAFQEDLMKKTFHAVWCINKLDIEHVVRCACENILFDQSVDLQKRLQTAKQLQSLGIMFLEVSKKKQQEVLQEERRIQKEKAKEKAKARKLQQSEQKKQNNLQNKTIFNPKKKKKKKKKKS